MSERWRHKKHGTTYQAIGTAQVHCPDDAPLTDYECVTIYRCEQTGEIWVRRNSEFLDGSFEHLPAPPPTVGAMEE